MKICMIAFMICVCATITAEAARPRYYSKPAVKSEIYTKHYYGGGDQERCQAEADHMAANNISGHVWGCIGSFEGVGYGYSANCNTCTPNSPMTLTGDASTQGNNGRWYRVRSWR